MVAFSYNCFAFDATMLGSVARFTNSSCKRECGLVMEHLPWCRIGAGGPLCGAVTGFTRACLENNFYTRAMRAIRKGEEQKFQYNLN